MQCVFFHWCYLPITIFQHQYHAMIQASSPVLSFHLCSLKAPVVKQHSKRARSASMKRFQGDFEERNHQDPKNTLFDEITSFWEWYFSTRDGSLLFFIHCRSSRDCIWMLGSVFRWLQVHYYYSGSLNTVSHCHRFWEGIWWNLK